MRRKISGIIIAGIFTFVSWAIPKYMDVNNMITPDNAIWLLRGSVVGVIVAVFVLVWGFWPMLKRIRFQKPIRLTGGKSETEKVAVTEQPVPIAFVRGQLRTDDNGATKLGYYLLEQLTREKQMPRDFIDVYPQKLHLYLNSVSGPFLYFRFVIKSHALHTLDLHDSALSGFIEYKDHELAGEKKLEINETQATLRRESQATMVIKQFLHPETAAHFRVLYDDKDAEEAVFSFGRVSISAIAHRPDGTTESWTLPLEEIRFKRRIADEVIRS